MLVDVSITMYSMQFFSKEDNRRERKRESFTIKQIQFRENPSTLPYVQDWNQQTISPSSLFFSFHESECSLILYQIRE